MIGVCIVTYNQEQYIAQAIDSVLMQEDCGHEVVIYIGEDNSTDRTGAICDEYVSRSLVHSFNPLFAIKVIHNEKNLGLVGNTMNLLDIMRKDGCDYIAMLDGDDYWCDDRKLQKQIAYFDAHPEYGLVHTCIDLLFEKGLVRDSRTSYPEGNVFDMAVNYSIGNCSVVFKTELLDMIDFEEFQQQGLQSCDYAMYIIFASKAKFGFLPDHTAVWRRDIESVSGSFNMERHIKYLQNGLAHWSYLAKLFPDRWQYTEQERDNWIHMQSFNIAFRFGDQKRALEEAKLMSDADRKQYCLKIMCAHSKVLMWLWRSMRERRVRYV